MTFNHIGIYFGSFNPIHEGHIYVAKTALKTAIDKLYLVVSSQSPFKPLTELAPFKDRLEMARIAIKAHGLEGKVEAVDWEKNMYPSYTARTLKNAVPYLQNNAITIFMGMDNFLTIEKWKEPKYILENFGIYVIPRGEGDYAKIISTKVQELKKDVTPKLCGVSYSNPYEVVNIAATDIRGKISMGEEVGDVISKDVLDYITKNNLYSVRCIKENLFEEHGGEESDSSHAASRVAAV